MADDVLWTRRVAEWKASGEPSTTYSEGRGFSASALRYWAKRLETKRHAPPRVARLVRDDLAPEDLAGRGEIVVSVGGVRVAIGRDFDRATFLAVVQVLRELEAP